MSSVWFTSDLHLFHQLVSELRGFENIYDHNNKIVENWTKVIKPEDQVWLLGDLTCTAKANVLEEALLLIDSLPGTKHLISGNHDMCFSGHRDSFKWQKNYLQVFDSVQTFARRSLNGKTIMLSHFPYSQDNRHGKNDPNDKYLQYRLINNGAVLLHGHTHSSNPVIWPNSKNEIHIGLDAWNLQPVNISTIEKIISTGKVK